MAERSEEATPKRLEEARKKGQVAKSRDLGSAVVLLGVTAALGATGAHGVASLVGLFRLAMRGVAGDVALSPSALLGAALVVGLEVALPLLLVALVLGTVASIVQTGPLLAWQAAQPKLERFDVVKGFARLFSRDSLLEALRSFLKVAIVGYVAFATLRGGSRGVLSLGGRGPLAVLEAAGSLVAKLGYRVGAALLAVALADVLYRRWKHRRDLRMTKEEVRRESKEAEGDPHAKQERQRAYQEMVAYSAVEAARTATVVVVNPTHLAVALRYEQDEMEAPEVVAKGEDALARRIVEAAREAGVPVMRDVPLARALFDLDVGTEIPEALYEAVAAILRAAWAEESGDASGAEP